LEVRSRWLSDHLAVQTVITGGSKKKNVRKTLNWILNLMGELFSSQRRLQRSPGA
jgi:hypothetical protein